MSIDALRRVLERLDEPTSCAGTAALTERLAIMLPDGDVGAIDDPGFVDWLVEHGEPAPFGKGGETKLDMTVRRAIRLAARGAARVTGFDPADVLGEIETALSPRRHLTATLTDVVVYPPGGHFVRHKDTPTSAALVGTLIVCLPIEHAGGVFEIDDGIRTEAIDWSGPADRDAVRWVAIFSDVDHAIRAVERGARVTLVYALEQSERPREDPDWRKRVTELRATLRDLEMPMVGPLMIACTRHVIAEDGPQPQSIDTLRGGDRDLADVLAAAGFAVNVRTCVVARDREYDPPDTPPRLRPDYEPYEIFFARLDKPLLDHDIAQLLDCVVFGDVIGDGGGFQDDEASTLRPFILDEVPVQNWIIRRTAAATLLHEQRYFASDGFVGNAASDACVYKLAALEVTVAGTAA